MHFSVGVGGLFWVVYMGNMAFHQKREPVCVYVCLSCLGRENKHQDRGSFLFKFLSKILLILTCTYISNIRFQICFYLTFFSRHFPPFFFFFKVQHRLKQAHPTAAQPPPHPYFSLTLSLSLSGQPFKHLQKSPRMVLRIITYHLNSLPPISFYPKISKFSFYFFSFTMTVIPYPQSNIK